MNPSRFTHEDLKNKGYVEDGKGGFIKTRASIEGISELQGRPDGIGIQNALHDERAKTRKPDLLGTKEFFGTCSKPAAKIVAIPRRNTDEEKLNKTEKAWLQVLRSRPGDTVYVQAISLKIGDDCRYNPDFMVITKEGDLVLWEVKGFMRDDALVKLKTAARKFPMFPIKVVSRVKGEWQINEINP